MYCPACGHENPDSNRFCTSCGVDLAALREPGRETKAGGPGSRLPMLLGSTRRERLVTAGTVVAILVAVVAFFALDTGEEEPLDDPYTLAADAQCVAAKEAVAARAGRLGARGTSVEDYASALSEQLLVWRSEFNAIAPPPDRAAAAEQLSADLLGVSSAFAALAEAGRSGDGERVESAAADVDASTGVLEQTVADLGLSDCDALGVRLAPDDSPPAP